MEYSLKLGHYPTVASQQTQIIASFSPAKSLIWQTPLLLLGALSSLASIASASSLLTSGLAYGRSGPSTLGLTLVFGLGGLYVIGRSVIEVLRFGSAVEITEHSLRAYTGRDSEVPRSELTHAKATGRGSSSRVVVYGPTGPRLTIKSDVMNPSAKAIAAAITTALS